MSADLVAFLRARLDEDEAGVRPYVNEGGECRPWRADEVGGTVRVSPVFSGDDGVIARAATHLDAVHIARHDPARVLRQVEAGRALLELHESWPVLVEQPEPPDSAFDPLDVSSMSFSVSRRIAWVTTQQYRAVFGDDPPTAPMIRALAAIYRDHEDYREEWAL